MAQTSRCDEHQRDRNEDQPIAPLSGSQIAIPVTLEKSL